MRAAVDEEQLVAVRQDDDVRRARVEVESGGVDPRHSAADPGDQAAGAGTVARRDQPHLRVRLAAVVEPRDPRAGCRVERLDRALTPGLRSHRLGAGSPLAAAAEQRDHEQGRERGEGAHGGGTHQPRTGFRGVAVQMSTATVTSRTSPPMISPATRSANQCQFRLIDTTTIITDSSATAVHIAP